MHVGGRIRPPGNIQKERQIVKVGESGIDD